MRALLLLLCLTGCGAENSSYTPKQVQEAREFCKNDNTTLLVQEVSFSSGKYVKGLACSDDKGILYKLTVIYPKRETNDCGRYATSPCFIPDYSAQGTIDYVISSKKK